jgi:hypothetical protein
MMAGQREAGWNELLTAPVHFQAELVSTPVASFGPYYHVLFPNVGYFPGLVEVPPCAADAVARVSFKGRDEIPVGRRFRLTWHCQGNWFIHGRTESVFPNRASDEVGGYARGQKVEVLLEPVTGIAGAPIRAVEYYGMAKIPAFTDAPTIVPEHFPTWYDRQFAPKKSFPLATSWSLNGRTPLPGVFPIKDVVVTYASSARPGQIFSAAYDSSMQRVLVAPLGRPNMTSERVIEDPVVGLTTRIFDRSKTYTIQDHVDRIFAGAVWPLKFDVGNAETIAGLPCTKYTLS